MKTLTPTFDPAQTAEAVWPDESQQLLLQAALLDAPVAPQAWVKWQEMANLEAIDQASWKLLPLVYVNLRRLNVVDPLLAQARNIHFYHWRCNQLLFQQTASFLDLMHQFEIPVLILKGVALANLYYPDTGSRPMADLDVLVPIERFLPLCERLKMEGWKPTLRDLDKFALEAEPSFGLARPDGLQVDIHGHVLHANCLMDADAEFWAHARPFSFKERKTLTLSAEDHLLHVVSHGIRWCDVPPFRWIADAWWILERDGDSFDWERFIKQTRFHETNLEVLHGLKLMHDLLPMKFPASLLGRLEAIPSSGDVHVRYVFNTSCVPVSGWARAWAIWKGSGRSAPVYRLDGVTPQVSGSRLCLLEVRRILALFDYARKAMVRIALRFLKNPASRQEAARIPSSS